MEPTVDDNLYPRDGASYDEAAWMTIPEERVTEEAEQAAPFASSFAVLPHVVEWFDEQIMAAKNIDNVKVEEMVINGVKLERHVSIEVQVFALHKLGEILESKRRDFITFSEGLES